MSIRKVSIEEVTFRNTKKVREKSGAIYHKEEVKHLTPFFAVPVVDGKVVGELLKDAQVGQVLYFDHFAIQERQRDGQAVRIPSRIRNPYDNCIRYHAKKHGVKVMIRWTRARSGMVFPKVTIKERV